MSHTDHTKPYWARLREQGAAIEYHDHSKNECVIVPLEQFARELEHGNHHANLPSCGWELSWGYINEHPMCGCLQCNNKVQRKHESRRTRREGKREKRNWLQEVGRRPSTYEDYLDE